jgi:hypothetical protein
MEPITGILAALGGLIPGLLTPAPPPEVLKPGPGPGPLPGAPIGVYPDAAGQQVPPLDAAKHALQMNPSGMPPTAETSPIMQALTASRAAAPVAGDLLSMVRPNGQQGGGGSPAPASAPAGPPQAASAPKAPTQSPTPFNPAPGANANSGADVGKQAMDAAGTASGKSTLLGLDGDQWGAIGVASGILAQLFRPGPAAQVLTPSGGGPGPLPMGQLGADLSQPGSQRLGTTSQFAINSPSIGGAYGAKTSDLLKSLQG